MISSTDTEVSISRLSKKFDMTQILNLKTCFTILVKNSSLERPCISAVSSSGERLCIEILRCTFSQGSLLNVWQDLPTLQSTGRPRFVCGSEMSFEKILALLHQASILLFASCKCQKVEATEETSMLREFP